MSASSLSSSLGSRQHFSGHTKVLCCITSSRKHPWLQCTTNYAIWQKSSIHRKKPKTYHIQNPKGNRHETSKLKQLRGQVHCKKPMLSREAWFHEHPLSIQTDIDENELKIELLALIPWFNLLNKHNLISLKREKHCIWCSAICDHSSLWKSDQTSYRQPVLFVGINAQIAQNLSNCFLNLTIIPHTKQKQEGLLQKSTGKQKPSPVRWQTPEGKQA